MHKMPVWRQIITQLVLLIIGLFVILPIWGISRLAFDGSLHGRPTEFRFFPKQFSMETFLKVLDTPYSSVHFGILLQNSLIVSFGAAFIAIVLGASLAYAFARFRFPGRKPGLFILLLTAILPPVAFMLPLYIFLSTIGLRTTLLGLTIVYAVFAMPFCIWNMRAAFQAIPREVEESAFLDGASNLVAFGYITLPLALPSIAVAGLIAFLMAYSEFAIGFFFVEKPNTVTLAMAVYSMVQTQYNSGAQPWSYLGSMALIMSIPVVIIFLILQRTLLERMMFGNIGE
jgi:arabinogalactan oligomer/maltooligosaccharide transport system permease protein